MKKRIRMAFMTAAMFTLVTTVSQAQSQNGRGGAGGRRGGGASAAMFKNITLTGAQKASVDSIMQGVPGKVG